MKALFVDYFNISIACSCLIVAVLVIRLCLRRAPKAMTCVLWLMVFLRLAVPVHFESALSLRPHLPIVSEKSTGFFLEGALMPESQIPDFLPRERLVFSFGDWSARVDYVQLAAWIWIVVAIFFFLYAAVSYIVLRRRLRGAILLRKRVYRSEKLDGGFLLGYLNPCVYLPTGLDKEIESAIIAHEEAHRQRGDNWLKLFAFLCVAMHWYNPLVWVAYSLLCNDIEFACDERVIKNMSVDARRTYSSALLTVGKKYSRMRVCPLPFGESSLRQRISTVLNYRKPAVWICAVAVIAVLFSGIFLIPDPLPQYPAYYKQLTDMIGQPRETVVDKLGIELIADEYTERTGFYETPVCISYRGVEFELRLGFSVIDDCLWSFQYAAIYENDLQQAAEDTVKIAKQLQYSYGRASQHGNKRTLWLSEIDKASVLEKFENRYLAHEGVDSVSGYWQLTDALGPHTHAYWETLMNSAQWEQMWRGRNIGLSFQLKFSAWKEPDTNRVYLCLDYDTDYSSAESGT